MTQTPPPSPLACAIPRSCVGEWVSVRGRVQAGGWAYVGTRFRFGALPYVGYCRLTRRRVLLQALAKKQKQLSAMKKNEAHVMNQVCAFLSSPLPSISQLVIISAHTRKPVQLTCSTAATKVSQDQERAGQADGEKPHAEPHMEAAELSAAAAEAAEAAEAAADAQLRVLQLEQQLEEAKNKAATSASKAAAESQRRLGLEQQCRCSAHGIWSRYSATAPQRDHRPATRRCASLSCSPHPTSAICGWRATVEELRASFNGIKEQLSEKDAALAEAETKLATAVRVETCDARFFHRTPALLWSGATKRAPVRVLMQKCYFFIRPTVPPHVSLVSTRTRAHAHTKDSTTPCSPLCSHPTRVSRVQLSTTHRGRRRRCQQLMGWRRAQT